MRSLVSSAAAAGLFLLPVAAHAQDASAWAGFNIGIQASTGNGFQDYGGGTNYDAEGEAYDSTLVI